MTLNCADLAAVQQVLYYNVFLSEEEVRQVEVHIRLHGRILPRSIPLGGHARVMDNQLGTATHAHH